MRRSVKRRALAALAAVLLLALALWPGPPAGAAQASMAQALAAPGQPALIEFGADYCPPCRVMAPILKAAQKEYAGRATVLSIDVTRYPALADKAGVRVIPTLVFYDAQGRETARHEGVMDRAELRARLDRLLAR